MLALKHRFHGHNSLRPLYQKGKSVYSRNMKLLWLPAHNSSYRAAVVVSKKVHKSAVVRNRIRRRIYGLVAGFIAENPLEADIVFLVQNTSPATCSVDELRSEVTNLLSKIA